MEDSKEFQRVLDNPEHLIISEELQDIVDVYDNNSTALQSEVFSSSRILVGDQPYECSLKKIVRLPNKTFVFKAEVPKFPMKNFIEGEIIKLEFHDLLFSSEESPSIAFRDDGMLTFTARRILKNEKV